MTALRLRAVDTIDLSVVSAHVQDAIAQVGDIAYEPGKRRFALMLNRFMWEDLSAPTIGAKPDKDAPFRRVRSALHFDAVQRVQHQGLKLGVKSKVAELPHVVGGPAGPAITTFKWLISAEKPDTPIGYVPGAAGKPGYNAVGDPSAPVAQLTLSQPPSSSATSIVLA